MPAETRDRILESTAVLFRRYGYNGTGLKEIVAQANAPFGSLYHFFPGGKQQLGAEVINRSGELYRELVAAVFDAESDPVAGTMAIYTGAAALLEETDYADACPIATVALEVASACEPLRQATGEVFESWVAAATERFAAAGLADATARALGITVIAQLEGGFILSRATRSTEPLLVAGEMVSELVRARLEDRPT